MDARQVARAIFADPSRAFTVKLWDGSTLPAHVDRARGSALVIRDEAAVETLWHTGFHKQWAHGIDVADEFLMRERVGDKITYG